MDAQTCQEVISVLVQSDIGWRKMEGLVKISMSASRGIFNVEGEGCALTDLEITLVLTLLVRSTTILILRLLR